MSLPLTVFLPATSPEVIKSSFPATPEIFHKRSLTSFLIAAFIDRSYYRPLPTNGIQDITVITTIEGTTGIVNIKAQADSSILKASLSGFDQKYTTNFESGQTTIVVPDAHFWYPDTPNRYRLTVEQWNGDTQTDSYTIQIGIREVAIDGTQAFTQW